MNDSASQPALDRRTMIKAGLGALAAGAVGGRLLDRSPARAAVHAVAPVRSLSAAPIGPSKHLHLAATDGWASMPTAGVTPRPPYWPDPMAPDPFNTYVFGFRDVTGKTDAEINAERGKAQISAPVLGFDEDDEVTVTLSNLGLVVRPDLTDGHTIHWHGFVNAIPLFDGVPELSISVPIGRSFTYLYRPHDAGTYMYHCHFEDVEHVQMGMTGVLFVRPKQNKGVGPIPPGTYAYNDGVLPGQPGSTAYDRDFAFILSELWTEAHYRDAHIQTTDWTDFSPSFWLMNGRAYPDTLKPSTDPFTDTTRLQYNPVSSLITCNQHERVLLRVSSLGYQHHAMTLDGIPMRVVAKDAALLRGHDGTDLSYTTNTIEVGPGESRDAIFVAPAYHGPGPYDVYRFYDRRYSYLDNGGDPGYGGMLTEVRVYPSNAPAPAIHPVP